MVLIMKKTLKIFSLAALVFFGLVGGVLAQKSKLKYADEQMKLMNYKHAIDMYQEVYQKKPTLETARLIAGAYDIMKDYQNSYQWWKIAVGYDESGQEEFIQLLHAGHLTENVDEAKLLIRAKGIDPDAIDSWEAFSGKTARNLKFFSLDELNSPQSDFYLSPGPNESQLFVSDRGGSYPSIMPAIRIDGRNKYFSDDKSDYTDRKYFTIYIKNKEGQISEINPTVPGTMSFSDPSYAPKSKLLFYSVIRSIKKVKKQNLITVQPEIFYSKITPEGKLEGFNAFPFNDSLNHSMMHPYVDEEAKRLYFSSDMAGGHGGYDLYYSEFDDEMNFKEPVNLGSEVNTPGNESYPFRKDSKFYFASDGHTGMGGLDVFQGTYSPSSISNIDNMGSPINSLADDFAYREDNDRTVYLSSNRKGGMGLDDLYLAKDEYKHFLGRVLDCNGQLITDSYQTTFRDKTQRTMVSTTRNPKGELIARIDPDSDFGISISKPGFFSLTDETISTKDFQGDTVKREYKLVPIPYQLPVYVDIVYYDLDKFVIRKDAMPALDKLAELMQSYSFLDLLVASHTDSRASDEYNITLSNNRAKAVSEYLAAKGIHPNRVRLEWFGERQLVNDCDNGLPCSEDNHQLNRRSELVLEAFPDPTKQYDVPQEFKNLDFCQPEDIFIKLQEEVNDILTIYFDFDKSILRPVHMQELERTAAMLHRMPNLQLYIEGHTDQKGTDEYNVKLSERRTKVVMEYLTNRGIESNRMQYRWFGERRPVHDCNSVTCTPAMHQLNRRTELRVGKKSFENIGS